MRNHPPAVFSRWAEATDPGLVSEYSMSRMAVVSEASQRAHRAAWRGTESVCSYLTLYHCRVLVQGTLSLQELIDAGGYDWVHSEVADIECVSLSTIDVVTDCLLLAVGKVPSIKRLRWVIASLNLRPANIRELLAIGAARGTRDLQRHASIVALDAIRVGEDGWREVAYLCGLGTRRNLFLRKSDDVWRERTLFAAVGRRQK